MVETTKYPGRFVTYEGIDGIGKSTHAHLLTESIAGKGHTVRCYREPGTTPMGEAIRRIVKDRNIPRANLASCFLFEAARADFTEKVILPELKQGNVVVCDRFCDSTTAYQGYASGIPLPLVEILNKAASHDLVPDLTFLIDAEPEQVQELVARVERKEDYFDTMGLVYQRKLREGFLAIARKEPERVVIIQYVPNGQQEMQELMRKELTRRFGW